MCLLEEQGIIRDKILKGACTDAFSRTDSSIFQHYLLLIVISIIRNDIYQHTSLYTCTWYLTIAIVTNYLQSCACMSMCMYTCVTCVSVVCTLLFYSLKFHRFHSCDDGRRRETNGMSLFRSK